jgi:hypothetical protein
MTLLGAIQASATGEAGSVAVLLRQCKVLASRLDHAGFAEWVESELNGYPEDAVDRLPEYRRLRGLEVRAHIIGPMGSQNTSAVIPPAAIDETHREPLFNADLIHAAAVLENIVSSADSSTLHLSWPADAVLLYADKVFQFERLISAHKLVPVAAMAGALDAIRNRVLSFALEIERANPDAGEAPIGTAPVPPDRIERAFAFNILGGTNVITVGEIKNVLALPGGPWVSLEEELRQAGLPVNETDALATALSADREAIDRGELGPATQSWLGRITARVEQGAVDLGASAGGGVIAGIVLRYLGLS